VARHAKTEENAAWRDRIDRVLLEKDSEMKQKLHELMRRIVKDVEELRQRRGQRQEEMTTHQEQVARSVRKRGSLRLNTRQRMMIASAFVTELPEATKWAFGSKVPAIRTLARQLGPVLRVESSGSGKRLIFFPKWYEKRGKWEIEVYVNRSMTKVTDIDVLD